MRNSGPRAGLPDRNCGQSVGSRRRSRTLPQEPCVRPLALQRRPDTADRRSLLACGGRAEPEKNHDAAEPCTSGGKALARRVAQVQECGAPRHPPPAMRNSLEKCGTAAPPDGRRASSGRWKGALDGTPEPMPPQAKAPVLQAVTSTTGCQATARQQRDGRRGEARRRPRGRSRT